jgi:hypothetical protein
VTGKKAERYNRNETGIKEREKKVWKARNGSANKIERKKNKRVSKEK